MLDGEPRRFCQQCCGFHELAAFDGTKRWEHPFHASLISYLILALTHITGGVGEQLALGCRRLVSCSRPAVGMIWTPRITASQVSEGVLT